MHKFSFDAHDLRLDIPTPGWYPARIQNIRWRRSPKGHRMLQVVYEVAEVDAAYARIAEYFVLEGTSSFGLSKTRRRLVELFRSAGFELKPGDEISPSELIGSVVDLEFEHEAWRGQPRLVVVGHQPHRELEPIPC